MRLDLSNNIDNNTKFIQDFLKELQDYLEKEVNIPLINPTHNENKIITEFRDKMYIERSEILNDYAKQTSNRGEMYYIYDKNSKLQDGYNLCICKEENSHTIIEGNSNILPKGATIGSVLRKFEGNYILDNEATKDISERIEKMKDELLEKQTEFLNSKRVEGHIYEVSENGNDRVWIFDITNNSDEALEEISFSKELLQDAKVGDLFVYENGEYKKYLK